MQTKVSTKIELINNIIHYLNFGLDLGEWQSASTDPTWSLYDGPDPNEFELSDDEIGKLSSNHKADLWKQEGVYCLRLSHFKDSGGCAKDFILSIGYNPYKSIYLVRYNDPRDEEEKVIADYYIHLFKNFRCLSMPSNNNADMIAKSCSAFN